MNDLIGARIATYRFEVSIARGASDVWTCMTDDIDAWWMTGFRALGADSRVSLSAEAGGQLIERASNGDSLQWYRVQMVSPGRSLHLVGDIAPDWGGPTTSMLKLELEDRARGCALIVSDALVGNVTEASADRAEAGWKKLFGEGLKRFVEP